jgi:hypothetical protein
MVRVLMGIFCVLAMANPCLAEMRQQKQKLFEINIPQGWSCEETATKFLINDPEKKDAIVINFGQTVASSEKEALSKLKQTLSFMSSMYKNTQGIKETRLDKVKALRLDFTWTDEKGTASGSHIACYKNGFDYQIIYSSPDEQKKALMDETVKSFSFKRK